MTNIIYRAENLHSLQCVKLRVICSRTHNDDDDDDDDYNNNNRFVTVGVCRGLEGNRLEKIRMMFSFRLSLQQEKKAALSIFSGEE